MKSLNILLILLLLPPFLKGCTSHETRFYRNKAIEIIKSDLINTLEDYESYDPIATEISRQKFDYLGDTIVQNLIKEIRVIDSIVDFRRGEEEKAYRAVKLSRYPYDKNKEYVALYKWGRASSARFHAEKKLLILVDSLLLLVEKQNSNIYGWKIRYKIKHKGDEVHPKEYDYIYYTDRDCNKILYKIVSSDNNNVEFAERIYDWAIERKKKSNNACFNLN